MSARERKLSFDSAKIRRTASAMPAPKSASVSRRPFTASSSGRARRPYSAYTKRGSDEQVPKYDAPESNREWWRGYVKETPVPGSYQHKGFVEELNEQSNTYGFRGTGRRPTSARFHSSGELLLPGAYEHDDFISAISQRPGTYNFQCTEKDKLPKIGHGYGDKELDTSPTWYDLRIRDAQKQISEKNMKDSTFKSTVKRKIEHNHQFRVIEGPGPGLYEERSISNRPTSATINSVFVSKVKRFKDKGSTVPGPGTYNISTSAFGKPKPLPDVSLYLKKKTGITVS